MRLNTQEVALRLSILAKELTHRNETTAEVFEALQGIAHLYFTHKEQPHPAFSLASNLL